MTAPKLPDVDLDDVSKCPTGTECEVCLARAPRNRQGLDVGTAATPVGVYCFTWCDVCADLGEPPGPANWPAAIEWVQEHCGHLGIDADQMAAILDAESKMEDFE